MNLCSAALNDAVNNWARWQDVFTSHGEFSEFELFKDSRIFLGFCKEYSVFRRGPEETLRLAEWLRNQENPISFEQFHTDIVRAFPLGKGGEKLISLASKILCNWRPGEFAMWDKFARVGLGRWKWLYPSQAVKPQFSEFKVSQSAKPVNYNIYRNAFFNACSIDQAFQNFVRQQVEISIPPDPAFEFRAFDNYLMKLGQLKGSEFTKWQRLSKQV